MYTAKDQTTALINLTAAGYWLLYLLVLKFIKRPL